jgi:hypothetical protein
MTLNATEDADKGITEFLANMGKAMDELKKIIDRKE